MAESTDKRQTLRQVLEEALVANPADVAAHAAYADLLMEQGDPRGEFIRVQLALEDPEQTPAERRRLLKRERQLLSAHQRTWLGELVPYLLDEEDAEAFCEPGQVGYQHRFARGWLDSVEVLALTEPFGRVLAQAPQARLLRRLVIKDTYPETGDLRPLLDSPHLGNVRELQLGGRDGFALVHGEEVVPLVRLMPRLEDLHLEGHGVDTDALFSLPLPHLRCLRVYHLRHYPVDRLAANPTLGRLTELRLHPHALHPGGRESYLPLSQLRAVARSPHLRSLNYLQWRVSDAGDAGVEEIVAAGLLRRLKVLDLAHGRVTDIGARLLAECPDFGELERLNLTENCLTESGIALLSGRGVAAEADAQHSPDDDTYLLQGDWE